MRFDRSATTSDGRTVFPRVPLVEVVYHLLHRQSFLEIPHYQENVHVVPWMFHCHVTLPQISLIFRVLGAKLWAWWHRIVQVVAFCQLGFSRRYSPATKPTVNNKNLIIVPILCLKDQDYFCGNLG